jgi:hypothetical protein
MELYDLQNFIKENSKIISTNVSYTDEYDIYEYNVNIEGVNHKIKIMNDGDLLKIDYNDKIIDNDIDIQLELFEVFNYKNIEYIDCYLLKKQQTSGIEVLNMYDDHYDNNDGILICDRSFKKDERIIKIKIVVYDNGADYKMYYNLEEINGFDEIIKKLELIL